MSEDKCEQIKVSSGSVPVVTQLTQMLMITFMLKLYCLRTERLWQCFLQCGSLAQTCRSGFGLSDVVLSVLLDLMVFLSDTLDGEHFNWKLFFYPPSVALELRAGAQCWTQSFHWNLSYFLTKCVLSYITLMLSSVAFRSVLNVKLSPEALRGHQWLSWGLMWGIRIVGLGCFKRWSRCFYISSASFSLPLRSQWLVSVIWRSEGSEDQWAREQFPLGLMSQDPTHEWSSACFTKCQSIYLFSWIFLRVSKLLAFSLNALTSETLWYRPVCGRRFLLFHKDYISILAVLLLLRYDVEAQQLQ